VGRLIRLILYTEDTELAIELYEVNPKYINYIVPYAPHLFHNKQPGQHNERKYIGIILIVNDMKYFAPLSSYKQKHDKMKNSLDFIKIGNYAVVNINNMFPVPDGEYTYVNISEVKNEHYRKLLMAEYRILKKLQDKIKKNALELYKHKKEKGISTTLSKRCNDFSLLEEKCRQYGGSFQVSSRQKNK
jgi:protein AbiQ